MFKKSTFRFVHRSEKHREQLAEMVSFSGVLGVVLDGLQVIIKGLGSGCFCRSIPQDKWKHYILQIIGEVQQCYEAGNLQQMVVVDAIQRKWAEEEICMMLMKGQAMGTYYPEPKHRCPGDIDCFLFDDYAKGNIVAKAWADKVDEGWYKHSVISYGGQTIENHQFFVHTREGKNSKELNQALCDTLKDVH